MAIKKIKPLVSILIPVYNRDNLVRETIESAISQIYTNVEIIIVDNCSTDNTWQVLENYAAKDSRIRIFQNKENIGPVRNWKRCIDEAKGEYAKILFSDDLISNNFIDICMNLMDDKAAFVISAIETISEIVHPKINYRESKVSTRDYLYDQIINNEKNFTVSPGNALFRTRDLRNALEIKIENSFDINFEKTGAGNDLLLLCKIAIDYPYIRTTNIAVSYFREHLGSISGEKTRQLRKYYEFAKVYFVNMYFPSLRNALKTKHLLKQFSNKYKDAFYSSIKGTISILYLWKKLLYK